MIDGEPALKARLAITVFGLFVCWSGAALSATPAKAAGKTDQVDDLAPNSATSQRKQHKNPDAALTQKSPEKERAARPSVVGEPLGPFSPLHIDP